MPCTNWEFLILKPWAGYIMLHFFLQTAENKHTHPHMHTLTRKTLKSNQCIVRQAFLETICDKIFSKEYKNTDIKIIILVSKTTKNKIREKYNQEIFPQVLHPNHNDTKDETPLTSELLA